MKRITLALSCLLALCLCCACAKGASSSRPPEEPAPSDAIAGVVETSGTAMSSRIVLFDEKLDNVGEIALDKATVGDFFYDACTVGDVLYISSLGYANEKDNAEILGVSLNDMSLKSYKTNRPALTVAANENWVYGCGNVDGSSYIEAVNKETGEIRQAEFFGQYVDLILWADDCLLAFGSREGNEGLFDARITRLDEDLSVVRDYDIDAFGSGSSHAVVCEGRLYFTYSLEESEIGGVGVLDLETGEAKSLDLDVPNPASLLVHGERLYVAHQDLVSNSNASKGVVSIYDLRDGLVETKELPFGPYQMVLRGSTLLFLDVAERTIFSCDIDTMDQFKSARIDPKGEDYMYLSALLPMN